MNGAQLRARRKTLGLTQSELAEALEVSANTVARWERDEMAMPGMIGLALKSLEAKTLEGQIEAIMREPGFNNSLVDALLGNKRKKPAAKKSTKRKK